MKEAKTMKRSLLVCATCIATVGVVAACASSPESATPDESSSSALSATTTAASADASAPIALRVRLLAGSSKPYTDTAGNLWTADEDFDTGTADSNGDTLAGTTDPTLYHSERYADRSAAPDGFTYTFASIIPGSYRVTLDFAETSNGPIRAAGERLFDVYINGTRQLAAFDIYSAAGGLDKAVSETFTVQATDSLTLRFAPGTKQNPKVNALSVVPLFTVSPTTTAAIPATFFGQHWTTTETWPTIPFGSGKFGPGVEWSTLETSRGVYELGSLIDWIEASKQAGHGQDMTFMYALIHTPEWAGGTGNPPDDLHSKVPCKPPLASVTTTDCKVKEFLTTILDDARVCTGTAPHKTCAFTSWELHNEVNVSDGEWAGTYADLAQLDADAIETIKGQCSSCIVLGANVSAGGDGWHANKLTSAKWDEFLTDYLGHWPTGMAMPDALSWHPYPSHDDIVKVPFPETYAGSDCPSDSADGGSTVCRQLIVDQVATIREIADDGGMKGKPLWATEAGFTNAELTGTSTASESELRAAYIARYLLALASGGVQKEFWFEWDNPSTTTTAAKEWGSEYADGSLTSVAVAHEQVYAWLVGNTFTAPCSNGGAGTVWTCNLTGPDGLVERVVWDTNGASTYSVPSTYLSWRGLGGPAKTKVSGGNVTLGIEPIALLNQ